MNKVGRKYQNSFHDSSFFEQQRAADCAIKVRPCQAVLKEPRVPQKTSSSTCGWVENCTPNNWM